MFSVSFVMIIWVTARVLSMSLLTATVSFLFLMQTICRTTARTDVPWSSVLFFLTFLLKVWSGSLINFTLSAVTCHQKNCVSSFFYGTLSWYSLPKWHMSLSYRTLPKKVEIKDKWILPQRHHRNHLKRRCYICVSSFSFSPENSSVYYEWCKVLRGWANDFWHSPK